MNEELIRRWNAIVKPEDVVYVLGDFAYKSRLPIKAYVERLNGHKHLIMGNHDLKSYGTYLDAGFESVQEIMYLTVDNQEMVLFHYPILSWKRRGKGSWHLYGHMHERREAIMEQRSAYNVGVDTNGYAPISFDQLRKIMETRSAKIEDEGESDDSTRPQVSHTLLCSKCGRIACKVSEDIVSVQCWLCCAHAGGPPPATRKEAQTSNRKLKGWKFMKVFVDQEGNVYHKGVEQPDLKGTLPATVAKPRKSKFEREQEKAKKEQRLVARHERKLEKQKAAEEQKQQKINDLMDDTKDE